MTVAELIAKLQTMDQSLPVYLGATEGIYTPVPLDEEAELDWMRSEIRECITDGKYNIWMRVYDQIRVVMIDLPNKKSHCQT